MKLYLFPLFALLMSSSQAWAEQAIVDQSIQKFLTSHENQEEQESAEARGSTLADLDGDGKPEIVLVWTTLGPTYFRNTLSVLRDEQEVASVQLIGEAELGQVKGDTITVHQLTLGPNDAHCCPSLKKDVTYRFSGHELAVDRNVQ